MALIKTATVVIHLSVKVWHEIRLTWPELFFAIALGYNGEIMCHDINNSETGQAYNFSKIH